MTHEIDPMVRLDGKIPKSIKDKAKRDSRDLLGKENITGLIVYLIKNYKSK